MSSSSQSRSCNRRYCRHSILSSSWMVSGPHSSKMALSGLFSISKENSTEIFEMLLPKSYCREYADIVPTCQISGFLLCKIDWANLAKRLSKRTFTELNSLEKFFTKYVCVGLTVVFQDHWKGSKYCFQTTISWHSCSGKAYIVLILWYLDFQCSPGIQSVFSGLPASRLETSTLYCAA